eukprot:5009128-Amphidinium_carterae.1
MNESRWFAHGRSFSLQELADLIFHRIEAAALYHCADYVYVDINDSPERERDFAKIGILVIDLIEHTKYHTVQVVSEPVEVETSVYPRHLTVTEEPICPPLPRPQVGKPATTVSTLGDCTARCGSTLSSMKVLRPPRVQVPTINILCVIGDRTLTVRSERILTIVGDCTGEPREWEGRYFDVITSLYHTTYAIDGPVPHIRVVPASGVSSTHNDGIILIGGFDIMTL